MKSTENAENSALVAVITGDLVGSSKLSGEAFSQVIINLERLLKSFRASLQGSGVYGSLKSNRDPALITKVLTKW